MGSNVSLFSDIKGIHIARLDNTEDNRKKFRQKLIGAGCDVDLRADSYTDPSRSGDFEVPVAGLLGVSAGDPFDSPAVAAPVVPPPEPKIVGDPEALGLVGCKRGRRRARVSPTTTSTSRCRSPFFRKFYVGNLRQNRLDPKQWCIVVARLEAANVMGVDFVRRFSPGFVPVGSGQGFCALMQTEDALEALAAAGLPVEHGLGMQRAAATIPAGSVMVVCSVAGGVTSAVIPFAGKDLPAPDPQSNLGAIPPVGRRRWALVQANLATIE